MSAGYIFTEADLGRIVAEVCGECPVTVYQTGGGVATAFVGSFTPAADGDGERAWLAIGPGWFTGPGWAGGVFDYAECYVGLDVGPDEADRGRYVRDEADLRAALRELRPDALDARRRAGWIVGR